MRKARVTNIIGLMAWISDSVVTNRMIMDGRKSVARIRKIAPPAIPNLANTTPAAKKMAT